MLCVHKLYFDAQWVCWWLKLWFCLIYRERLILSGYDWRLMTEDWGLRLLYHDSSNPCFKAVSLATGSCQKKRIIKKLSQMLLEKFVKTWQFWWFMNSKWRLSIGESCADRGEKPHFSLGYFHFRHQYLQILLFFSSIDAELFGLASVLRQRRLKSKCLSLTSDPVSFVSTGNEFVFFTFCSLKNKKLTSCPKSTQVPKYKQN